MAKNKRLAGHSPGPLSGVPRGARNGFRESKTPRGNASRSREEMVVPPPYEQGEIAKAKGLGRSACPYDTNSSMGESWLAGWDEADYV